MNLYGTTVFIVIEMSFSLFIKHGFMNLYGTTMVHISMTAVLLIVLALFFLSIFDCYFALWGHSFVFI